jgi:hypothetical protein
MSAVRATTKVPVGAVVLPEPDGDALPLVDAPDALPEAPDALLPDEALPDALPPEDALPEALPEALPDDEPEEDALDPAGELALVPLDPAGEQAARANAVTAAAHTAMPRNRRERVITRNLHEAATRMGPCTLLNHLWIRQDVTC